MNNRIHLFVVKIVSFTIAALLVVTGLVYGVSSSKEDLCSDMKCEEVYTGETTIFSTKAGNNKERMIRSAEKMVYKVNRVINEKYPKESIIRVNSDDEIMEEVDEEPDEFCSAL